MKDDNMMVFLEAMLYAREGEDPSKAIENQERRGQQSVVRNQRLPKKLNDHSVPSDIRWNGVKDSMEWDEKITLNTQNSSTRKWGLPSPKNMMICSGM